jgi:hypothetical protein
MHADGENARATLETPLSRLRGTAPSEPDVKQAERATAGICGDSSRQHFFALRDGAEIVVSLARLRADQRRPRVRGEPLSPESRVRGVLRERAHAS